MLFRHLVLDRPVWPVCKTREQAELLRFSSARDFGEVPLLYGDLTDSKTIDRLVLECRKIEQSPHALIHCPGPIVYSSDAVPEWELWENQFHDNMASAVHLVRAFSGMMSEGRMIFFTFSGTGSMRGYSRIAAYAAAKESLAILVRSAAKRLARWNITVNAIAPGVFLTEDGRIPVGGSEMLPHIPLSRFGQVCDITGVVDWLLSPDSSYVTGQVIKVSGGLHIS